MSPPGHRPRRGGGEEAKAREEDRVEGLGRVLSTGKEAPPVQSDQEKEENTTRRVAVLPLEALTCVSPPREAREKDASAPLYVGLGRK